MPPGRDMSGGARTVGDGLAIKRHVQVAAHEDLLALEVGLGEVADLGLEGADESAARENWVRASTRARVAGARLACVLACARTDFLAISMSDTRETRDWETFDGMAIE